MRTIKKIEELATIKIESLAKVTMYLLMIMSLVLMLIALSSCSKDDPGTTMEPGPIEGGKVTGSVTDDQGNPYPSTRITLTKGSETISKATNADGEFTADTKDVGTYEITVIPPLSTELIGNVPSTVNVQTKQTTNVNFVIQPQAVKAHLNFGDVQLLEEILDKDGNTPVDPDEPLYAANIFDEPLGLLTAIKAPDDHHVTLSEFETAKGNLKVSCNGDSASIMIELEGLIPNGTYTFWLAYLNKTRKVGEAIDFMNDFVNPTNPPIGSLSGTENIAIAEADGTISMTLEHTSCILTDEVALVIPIIYHINGQTFGGGHIPDPEEMAHMLAYFQ